MPQFDVSATIDGESAVVTLSGEIDLDAGPAVRERLHELPDGGVRQVIEHLRQVEFLDLVGLGVLASAYRRLRDAAPAGSVRLVCTNERVLKVFRLTGLLLVLPMYATVEQASAANAHMPSIHPRRKQLARCDGGGWSRCCGAGRAAGAVP